MRPSRKLRAAASLLQALTQLIQGAPGADYIDSMIRSIWSIPQIRGDQSCNWNPSSHCAAGGGHSRRMALVDPGRKLELLDQVPVRLVHMLRARHTETFLPRNPFRGRLLKGCQSCVLFANCNTYFAQYIHAFSGSGDPDGIRVDIWHVSINS